MTPPIVIARDLLLAGDHERLGLMLDLMPQLVHARCEGVEPPYNGLFHQATLLHHLAGRPYFPKPVAGAPALARALLGRGAMVDAFTCVGPDTRYGLRWTTLGLVACGGQIDLLPLVDVLLAGGADVNAGAGSPLKGAIYHRQWAVAHHLVGRGATVDLIAAAGLGLSDAVDHYLAGGRRALVAQRLLVHYSAVPLPRRLWPLDILGEALAHAALGGHPPVLERLMDMGVPVNVRPYFDHGASALHWAVVGGDPDTVCWLFEHGADAGLRDRTYDATAQGWDRRLGRNELADLLPSQTIRISTRVTGRAVSHR